MAEIISLPDLKDKLRSGQLSLFQYLETLRNSSPYSPEKGITRMMQRYCENQGLQDIPDLDVVWKKPEWHSTFKVNNRRKDEGRTGKETTEFRYGKG